MLYTTKMTKANLPATDKLASFFSGDAMTPFPCRLRQDIAQKAEFLFVVDVSPFLAQTVHVV